MNPDTRVIGSGHAAAAGLLGAIAASSCCILPLALFSVGAGGAWIGLLSALSPYQPIIAVLTLGVLAYGFRLVYWPKQKACEATAACARPHSTRLVKAGLWLATALIAAALAFPFVAPIILES